MPVIASGCGSGSSDAPDAATETYAQESVDLDALPPAEGRTAFVVSEDMAVVGGGAVRSEDGGYEPVLDLWVLGEDGAAETLPPLRSEGTVQGLSGVQVGATLVVAGMECTPAASEFLICPSPRRPLVWMKDESAEAWTTVEIPDELVEGVLPDMPTGGVDLEVIGSHDNTVVLAFYGSQVTRFMAVDIGTEAVTLRGDGLPTNRGWSTSRACVTDKGEVLQAIRHEVGQETDGEGAQDVSLRRLDSQGRWTDGPVRRVGDIAATRNVRVWDLVCPAGGPVSLLVSVDGALQMEDEWVSSILVAGGADGLSLAPDTAKYGDLAAAGVTGARNLTPLPDGGVLVTAADGIVRASGGRASAVEAGSVDRITDWSNSTSVFAFSDLIGTIDHRTGEIHVDPIS